MNSNEIENFIYLNNTLLSEVPEPNSVFYTPKCFSNSKLPHQSDLEEPSSACSLSKNTIIDGGADEPYDSSDSCATFEFADFFKDNLDDFALDGPIININHVNQTSPYTHHNAEPLHDLQTFSSNLNHSNNRRQTICNFNMANDASKENETPYMVLNNKFNPVLTTEYTQQHLVQCKMVLENHITSRFPHFYTKLPDVSLAPNNMPHYPDEVTAKSAPKDDFYVPRFTRGHGISKLGLCPICSHQGEFIWLRTKTSAYWYHMNFVHGIHSKGRPYQPPIEFRTVRLRKTRNAIGVPNKKYMIEGKCHQCNKWIRCQGKFNITKKKNRLLLYMILISV